MGRGDSSMKPDDCRPGINSKWIKGVSSDQPLYKMARLILEARLDALPYSQPSIGRRIRSTFTSCGFRHDVQLKRSAFSRA